MRKLLNYDGHLASQVGNFRTLAQREAAEHRPASTATHPDANETGLRSDAEGFLSNEQTIFDGVVSEANSAANAADSRLIELRTDIQQVLADDTIGPQIEAEFASDRRRLVSVTAERIKAEVEWRSFRAQHGISTMPHYPDSLVLHWALVAAMILIETGINAAFYQNANGLIGGFAVAAAVAFVNMGSAVLLGNLFRRKNLASADQKFIGWLSLAIFLPLAIFCNALFAAFRSVYQTVEDPTNLTALNLGFQEAWAEAGRIFIFDYHFTDLSSFILFMFGIILSGVAFWKGYTSDDPFPGYSRRDRALKLAKNNELVAQELAKQKIKDLLTSHRNRVQGLASQFATHISMLSNHLSATEDAASALEANTAAIQRDFHLVLDAYQQSNLAVRGTPPPPYFNKHPVITGKVDASSAGVATAKMKHSMAGLENLHEKYRLDLNAKLNALQLQMSKILSETYARFISEIEEEARDLVERDIQTMPAGA